MALSLSQANSSCVAQAIQYPDLSESTIRSLTATPAYHAFEYIPPGAYPNNPGVIAANLNYCKVTVTYTPSYSDRITTVQVFLPQKDDWNGRMQGLGGGAWAAGLHETGISSMIAAVSEGFAAIGTDSGLGGGEISPRYWAFKAGQPGVVDKDQLRHWSYASLDDLSVIGKSVVKSYYGEGPKYSYWNGCSQGGRQGMALAQRYPKAFDGIAVAAPPIIFADLTPAGFWAQALFHQFKHYVNSCELRSLTAAAVKHCDSIDGVEDGLVSEPDKCNFDPFPMVNKTVTCWDQGTFNISYDAAYIAYTGWNGMQISNSSFLRNHHNTHEMSMVTAGVTELGPVMDQLNYTYALGDSFCSSDGNCIGEPFAMIDDWIKYFVIKDPDYDTTKALVPDLDDIMERSRAEYTELMGTQITNLTAFRDAGGKMLSYHGLVSLSRMYCTFLFHGLMVIGRLGYSCKKYSPLCRRSHGR